MRGEELAGFLYCDLGGIVRGRFMPADEAERRVPRGLGWVPANHALTPFGEIAEPNRFGSVGDLRILPDPDTRVRVDLWEDVGPLHFYLCDATELDGSPWECCPRTWLRGVLERFERETGARVQAAFEHEFQLVSELPAPPPFSLEALRAAEPFAAQAVAALRAAGAAPELLLPEYGAHQFEVPCGVATGLAAADRSVIVKEVVREVARRLGQRATFAPLTAPDAVGNGTHIHLSLCDADGGSLTYDEQAPGRLSALAAAFTAGVLAHAPALAALTAPTAISALRFAPHRWAASVACLGQQNRETLLRISPLVELGGADPAPQHNVEYRAADAAASPYLALGALVCAGLEGIRRELPCPPVLDRDPNELDAAALAPYVGSSLPDSLEHALAALEADAVASAWLPEALRETYFDVKRAELDAVAGRDPEEVCRRYARVY
ncbi:MAG TPA: glutamine synthetase family protein [Conexibacter sp.]|nr:glutamine synthetase family protein [Conexibacter sp.]